MSLTNFRVTRNAFPSRSGAKLTRVLLRPLNSRDATPRDYRHTKAQPQPQPQHATHHCRPHYSLIMQVRRVYTIGWWHEANTCRDLCRPRFPALLPALRVRLVLPAFYYPKVGGSLNLGHLQYPSRICSRFPDCRRRRGTLVLARLVS